MRAAFPVWGHLVEALFAGMLLLIGLLVAVLGALVRRGEPAGAAGPMVWVALAGSTTLVLLALRRLRAVRPLEVRLDRSGVRASAPPGVPLAPEELAPESRPRGGSRAVAWGAVRSIDSTADGLVIAGTGRPLLVAWQYRKGVGLRATGAFGVPYPAFRYEELDWIGALCERLRGGGLGALEDLVGERAAGKPSAPAEEPAFVLRGVTPGRLRAWVIAGALAAAAAGALHLRASGP